MLLCMGFIPVKEATGNAGANALFHRETWRPRGKRSAHRLAVIEEPGASPDDLPGLVSPPSHEDDVARAGQTPRCGDGFTAID